MAAPEDERPRLIPSFSYHSPRWVRLHQILSALGPWESEGHSPHLRGCPLYLLPHFPTSPPPPRIKPPAPRQATPARGGPVPRASLRGGCGGRAPQDGSCPPGKGGESGEEVRTARCPRGSQRAQAQAGRQDEGPRLGLTASRCLAGSVWVPPARPDHPHGAAGRPASASVLFCPLTNGNSDPQAGCLLRRQVAMFHLGFKF